MEQLNISNKKLKTAHDNIERDYDARGIALRDLPNEALAYAASYLARPSKALFAVALKNDASMNDTTNAILSLEQWKALDFGEIDANLAAKITDDYLRKILICIGANAKLNTLKLTGCVNITGAGLDPLRGSAVLEKVDLSLVAEHKSPVLDPKPLLSCEHVLPILDSINGRDANVLRSIVFPKSWRDIGAGNTAFHEFLGRCNQNFEGRNITCQGCDQLVREAETFSWFPTPVDGHIYGIQSFTCYSCMKNFCHSCTGEDGNYLLLYCDFCNKDYCGECKSSEFCEECSNRYCKECRSMEECGGCDSFYCGDCQAMTKCGGSPWGRHCNANVCEGCVECAPRHGAACDVCKIAFCDACSDFHRCDNCGAGYCGNCIGSDDAHFCEHCA